MTKKLSQGFHKGMFVGKSEMPRLWIERTYAFRFLAL